MINKKLFPYLLLLALFIWGYNIYQVKNRLSPSYGIRPSTPDTSIHTGQDNSIKQTTVYDVSLRDPFEAPGTISPVIHKDNGPKKNVAPVIVEPPPFAINGIMWDSKSPSVLLADTRTGEVTMASKGTLLNDLKVIDITQNSVKVKYKGKDFELR